MIATGKTRAEWIADTSVIADGAFAFETDTGCIKKGDGVNVFDVLPYYRGDTGNHNMDAAVLHSMTAAKRTNPDDTSLWPDLWVAHIESNSSYVIRGAIGSDDWQWRVYPSDSGAPSGLFDLWQFEKLASRSVMLGQSGTALAPMSDDTTPLRFTLHGTIGEGHGWETLNITKAGHGLVAADLGKTWLANAAYYYALYEISGNVLKFVIRPYTGTTTNTTFYPGAPTTMVATAVSGSTAGPADIDLSGATVASGMLIPSCFSIQQKFLVDGKRELLTGEHVRCKFFEVQQSYKIVDPLLLFAAVAGSVGTTADISALGSMAYRNQRFTFYPWMQIAFEDTVKLLSTRTMGENGGPIQMRDLTIGSGGITNRYLWIPDTQGFTPSFSAPTKFETLSTEQIYKAANFVDPTIPTDWCAEFAVSTDAVATDNITLACILGYDPEYYETASAVRLPLVETNGAWRLATTRKVYPIANFANASRSANDVIRYAAFRSFVGSPGDGLIVRAVVKTASGWKYYLGWNENLGAVNVSVPAWLQNLSCSNFRSSGGELLSSVTGSSITIKTTASTGYMIVKIV